MQDKSEIKPINKRQYGNKNVDVDRMLSLPIYLDIYF